MQGRISLRGGWEDPSFTIKIKIFHFNNLVIIVDVYVTGEVKTGSVKKKKKTYIYKIRKYTEISGPEDVLEFWDSFRHQVRSLFLVGSNLPSGVLSRAY